MTDQIEPGKEYEFFLRSFKQVPRAGGQRFHMVWNGVDIDCEVDEYPLINKDGTPGPRIVELMQRLNGGKPLSPAQANPNEFFKRGMHIWAHLHRHWTETKTDDIKWEFRYETIRVQASKQIVEITDAQRTMVKHRARQSKTLAELRERLKADGSAYQEALAHMIKNGEIDLK
jgi:hypothetical protein